jgi:predicted transcriptional regulator
MSRPAWHAEARRMRDEGYSQDAIAYLLGKGRTTVQAALMDRDRWLAQRREQQRRWRERKKEGRSGNLEANPRI